jgi:hypothetical protein
MAIAGGDAAMTVDTRKISRMNRLLYLAVLGLAAGSVNAASISFTVEAPGQMTTTAFLPGETLVETVGSETPGTPFGPAARPIGTYTAGAVVSPANDWGVSTYLAMGAQSGTKMFQLTFEGDQDYFGLYWAALDGRNELQFWNDDSLVASFGRTELLASSDVAATHFGTPGTGINMGEAYAFVNFFADDAASRFDMVQFVNGSTDTGFETDNHTIRSMSGGQVPEPSTYVMAGVALAAALAWKRRK